MPINTTENFLAKLLTFGIASTSIFLISGSVTDPVNVPKLLILGITGSASFAVVISTKLRSRLKNYPAVLILLLAFVVQMLVSSFSSSSPFSQNLYGVYGRNNGFLTYLFFCLIFCSALCLQSTNSINLIIYCFFTVGFVNLALNLWVISFGDFIEWNNPYGNILGTFGNPNFAGAFLGMFFCALFTQLLNSKLVIRIRLGLLLLLALCFYEILASDAVQGIVVAASGSSIVLFLYIRAKFNKLILGSFTLASFGFAGLALAGALQKGPLTEIVYKTSVSLRGQYWIAGWNTGTENPFTGAGMDAFGDWYRRRRDLHALELPGVNTVVNAAHNVPLDMFAFGGWPLFLIYVGLMVTAGRAALRIIFFEKNFNPQATVLISTWAGYQLQSIISINQIGLAIWGWLLSGALITYASIMGQNKRNLDVNFKPQINLRPKENDTPAQVLITAFLGAIFGLLIAVPPFSSDLSWRRAQVAQSLPMIEQSMNDSYFNPPNTQKFIDNVDLLERSQLYDLSRKYALEAVKWNPNTFDLWKLLYLVQASTVEEKALAVANMRRLDPLNPDVTATK